jgi:hypothetical protein
MLGVPQRILVIAGVALVAYMLVALVQQKITPIPLVGGMLPR